MLNYTDRYEYWLPTESSETRLATIERRVAAKEQQLKDVEYELSLLKSERLKIYKGNITYLIENFCEGAGKWIVCLQSGKYNGEKIDGRKNYPEKSTYEYFKGWLEGKLGHQVELTQHLNYNFGEAHEFIFTCEGHKWQIAIPIVHNVKRESLDRYGKTVFQLTLHNLDREYISEWVGGTFDEDELKDIFNEGLKKYAE